MICIFKKSDKKWIEMEEFQRFVHKMKYQHLQKFLLKFLFFSLILFGFWYFSYFIFCIHLFCLFLFQLILWKFYEQARSNLNKSEIFKILKIKYIEWQQIVWYVKLYYVNFYWLFDDKSFLNPLLPEDFLLLFISGFMGQSPEYICLYLNLIQSKQSGWYKIVLAGIVLNLETMDKTDINLTSVTIFYRIV